MDDAVRCVVVSALLAVALQADEGLARVALATNNPIMWVADDDIGVSAYVGVTRSIALRANLATYSIRSIVTRAIDECGSDGRYTDESLGAQWYWKQRFDGVFVEGDVLRRSNPAEDYACEVDQTHTHSTWWGGRVLVGYTATLYRHLFVSIGAGISIGRETGHEVTTSLVDAETMLTHVDRAAAAPEWFFRIGAAL